MVYECQIQNDPAELRYYLLAQFEKMTVSELFKAITYTHNNRIQQAADRYVDEITDNTLISSNNKPLDLSDLPATNFFVDD